jgi:Mg-chelatase subunit ChlD/TolB-like protein
MRSQARIVFGAAVAALFTALLWGCTSSAARTEPPATGVTGSTGATSTTGTVTTEERAAPAPKEPESAPADAAASTAPSGTRGSEAKSEKDSGAGWSAEAAPDKSAAPVEKPRSETPAAAIPGSTAAGSATTGSTGGASGGTGATTTAKAAPKPKADASGLRAGYADDNKQFNYFTQFLDQYGPSVDHYPMDVSERILLHVKDSGGLPVANADVQVLGSGGQPILRARSYADGTVLFFPRRNPEPGMYLVVTTAFGKTVETIVDRKGKRDVDIVVPVQRSVPQRLPLDVVFVLDTTGSMGDEIERLKLTIELINMNLTSVSTNPLVRFGLVLYKDVGDEYDTLVVQPTDDLDKFQAELGKVYADGGGDTPEDLQAALQDAVRTVQWNTDGLRLAFVITDAPPHLDYGQTYTYADAAMDAQTKGVKIYTVGTGGLDISGEYVLRQISQYTYARYIFLTYGEQGESAGGAPGSVSHHTGANFQTDKLESIIIRFAREELAFQSAKPLEAEDEYFDAVKVTDEEREKTLATLFDMAIGQLADYASVRLPATTRAAAVPLVGADATLGPQAEYLSEQLLLSMSRSSLFRVVERQDLQKILGELELQLSGLVDDTQAAKVGNLLGADVLVTGRVYAKEDRYEVFLKLLRVETGEILSATKARVDRKLGI